MKPMGRRRASPKGQNNDENWRLPNLFLEISKLDIYATNGRWQIVELQDCIEYSPTKKEVFVYKEIRAQSINITLSHSHKVTRNANHDNRNTEDRENFNFNINVNFNNEKVEDNLIPFYRSGWCYGEVIGKLENGVFKMVFGR